MKNTANHIIHKQTIDIRFRDFDAAHKWTAAIQTTTAEAVRSAIENCLKDFEDANDYLTIDRIDLDLGSFGSDELLTQLPQKLQQQLRAIFKSQDTRSPIIKRSALDAFFFFLRQGHLPWWHTSTPDWQNEITTQNNKSYIQRQLIESLEANDHAITRLINQFDDNFLTTLITSLITNLTTTLPPSFTPTTRRAFWTNWIKYAVGKSTIPAPFTQTQSFESTQSFENTTHTPKNQSSTKPQPPEQTQSTQKTQTSQELKTSQSSEQPQFTKQTQISQQSQTPQKPKSLEQTQSFEPTQSFESPDNTTQTPKQPESPEQPQSPIKSQTPQKLTTPEKPKSQSFLSKDEFIQIPDAGLVILSPFLPQFFDQCHYLNKKEFINEEAQQQAIYALHYLSTTEQSPPEYKLMLPKLLCGIPLDWPVEQTKPLTQEEIAASQELLEEVIKHWKALRSTSPAGLRETFIKREGRLFATDEGWRLEIQRKTEDILMDRLPWGFSMIKYAWMPQRLTVAWE